MSSSSSVSLSVFLILSLTYGVHLFGQDNAKAFGPFDNQFFFGNRVTWGNSSGQWRYSGEIQFRMADNYQSLERWFLEGVASYLLSKNWELVPDLRFSIFSNRVELRPGMGVLYKLYPVKGLQLTTQVKYQADIMSSGGVNHSFRTVLFANYLVAQKFIPSFLYGPFWLLNPDYKGVQAHRVGAGCGFLIGNQHTLNFTYFFGNDYTKSPKFIGGALLVQLSINLRRDFKYLPGRIIIF